MKNNAKENLFELIRSLSIGEKRSITQFANYASSGEKKYLRLFEIIDSQKQYDENAVKQKLKKENIRRPLPAMKKYLLELISKSLQFYHAGKTVEIKINEYLSVADIYHSKGLTQLREKAIDKAKHLAEKFEKYEISLAVLNKELGFSYQSFKSREEQLDRQKKLIEKITYLRNFKEFCYSIEELSKKGKIRDESLRKEWAEIIQSREISTTAPAGFVENYYYHRMWKIYYEINENIEKTRYHSEELVKYIESRPEMLMENKRRYMAALNDLVISTCMDGDTATANEVFEKILDMQSWELNTMERDNLYDHILLANNNLLAQSIETRNLADGLHWAQRAENFIKNNSVDIVYRSVLYYNLSLIYLYTGNLKDALEWNRKILNETVEKHNEDIHHYSVLLKLIIHFDLNEFEMVPSLVRSTYRFLYIKKKIYKTEDAILRFIRIKLPKTNSQKELVAAFFELRTELEQITRDPFEEKSLKLFDILSWIDSKLENKPFIEILRKKAHQKNP